MSNKFFWLCHDLRRRRVINQVLGPGKRPSHKLYCYIEYQAIYEYLHHATVAEMKQQATEMQRNATAMQQNATEMQRHATEKI